MRRSLLVMVCGLLVCLAAIEACGRGKRTEILVLHAGSLAIPFKHMAAAFMEKYPEVEVKLEAYGSRTAARQISDLGRRAEVMGSADSAVIRSLLQPRHADFCIDFATNEMVLMYTGQSRYAAAIQADNWFEILQRPDVQFGHSDPNSDPCGYRAVLTMKLAEEHYRVPGLFQQLKARMPEKNIRPKEVDLIALLEAGELDYIFIYRSVARQHRAAYLVLPDEVNLKSPDLSDWYGGVSVRISGRKPGEWLEQRGTPMVYGLTLPKNARHPQWGIRFIDFVLAEQGRRIMEDNGQPQLVPPLVDHYDRLPGPLKKYFLPPKPQ